VNLQGMEFRKLCGRVSFSVGSRWEHRIGVRLQGTTRDSGRGATEMEHLSLCELCEQNLEEGSFAGNFVGNERKALWTGISLHGVQFVNQD
jgi:hypothetical protein